jgi:hypothetical protein
MDNLAIWHALERTDPAHVKEITGKAYRGNSPRPHYVIRKLTEQFGPIGVGFGWTVMEDKYVDGVPHEDGTEKMHEVRIRFWHTAPENCFESYGGTKALYKTSSGKWMSDEDAAKKSLTDAITKAASWLGVAADIFMGQWDDSGYVAELRREARAEKPEPPRPAPPKPAAIDAFIAEMDSAPTLEALAAVWARHRDMQNAGTAKAKDRNKARIEKSAPLNDMLKTGTFGG